MLQVANLQWAIINIVTAWLFSFISPYAAIPNAMMAITFLILSIREGHP